jgi:hypothetical protein
MAAPNIKEQLEATATARQAVEATATKSRLAAADQADVAKARAYVLATQKPGDVLDVDFGGGNVIKAQVQPDGSLVPFYGSPAATALAKAMARTAMGLDDSQRRTIVERV